MWKHVYSQRETKAPNRTLQTKDRKAHNQAPKRLGQIFSSKLNHDYNPAIGIFMAALSQTNLNQTKSAGKEQIMS